MANNQNSISFIYALFGFGKKQTNKQRAVIILVHFLAWLIFFSLPLLFFNIEISNPRFILREAINKLFLVAFFYLNYYYFIPAFFSRQKRKQYFFCLLFSFVFLFAEEIASDKFFFHGFEFNARPGFSIANSQKLGVKYPPAMFMHDSLFFNPAGTPPSLAGDSKMFPVPNGVFMTRMGPIRDRIIFGLPEMILYRLILNLFSSVFLMVLLGGFIRLAFSFFKSQDEKKLLANANLTAENNLLKSQINPHFLFNSLNSIYSQAMQKSENTEKSIMKLSEIMRYMIYETGSEKILIEKDLYYISSYIDLQRMRLSSKVTINYNVFGNLDNIYISPLILITYIENAFKHGISYSQSSVIDILIELIDKTLILRVTNPVVKEPKSEQGGIGQRNAKRRLELLYPDKYWLNIASDDDLYIVNLKINLAE